MNTAVLGSPKLGYDLNIWSTNSDSIKLTAYEQYRDEKDGMNIHTDFQRFHSITFSFPEDLVEIEYLLQDLFINQYPLDGYDDWIADGYLFSHNAPQRIRDFLEGLPDYE